MLRTDNSSLILRRYIPRPPSGGLKPHTVPNTIYSWYSIASTKTMLFHYNADRNLTLVNINWPVVKIVSLYVVFLKIAKPINNIK